ncbi:MAG: hypothetical protein ACI4GD_00635 [Lachnospiraceae bacterium]
MPTPPKPFLVLSTEGKSHRTKAELEQRKKGEEALATGKQMKERQEVKENEVAHKEYQRVNKLLKQIKKNDALYEPIINRYCLLQAECKQLEEERNKACERLDRLCEKEGYFEDFDEMKAYYKLVTEMEKVMVSIDKAVNSKRIMLLNIEKECVMTIAAALRSIPKKVEEDTDPLKGLNKYG